MREELRKTKKGEPTVDNIAEATNISPAEARRILQLGAAKLMSLDAPRFDNSPDTTIGDYVADPNDPFDILDRLDQVHLFNEILAKTELSEQESIVIEHIRKGNDISLAEVARTMGLTRQRVHQIYSQALKKFRATAKISN